MTVIWNNINRGKTERGSMRLNLAGRGSRDGSAPQRGFGEALLGKS